MAVQVLIIVLIVNYIIIIVYLQYKHFNVFIKLYIQIHVAFFKGYFAFFKQL